MNHKSVVCKKLCRLNHGSLDLENLELYGTDGLIGIKGGTTIM